jgi:putative hemolysin
MYALSTSRQSFNLQADHSNAAINGLLTLIKPGVERALGFPQLNAINAAASDIDDGDSAENRILRVMRVSASVDAASMERIPQHGPLLVVANHPFGGVEGLLLASMLKQRRSDVKIMANQLLGHIDILKDLFILVDVFGGDHARKQNSSALKEALRWLEAGGVLGVFPAGEVSHFDARRAEITDPEWSDTVARIAMHSGASVLPVFIEGRNGAMFHAMGMLHPRLRTMRLPHEFVNKCNSRISMRIGHVVSPNRVAQFKTAGDLTAYLRIRTYLQRRDSEGVAREVVATSLPPVAAPRPKEDVLREIASLPEEALLLRHEHFRVFITGASGIPALLHEIGRFRELTFRANNEGSGKPIDLDRFDDHYLHLFLWDDRAQEVAAAYRLGQTDVLLRNHGKKGLYTRTLFNIRKNLLKQISPALEMGRSFVRVEYQRQFLPLLLLWRGIGSYVARNPRYSKLFGPVSINSEYSNTSQRLMVDFFRLHATDERARMVRPRTPLQARRLRGFDAKSMSTTLRDLSDLSSLVSDIEEDRKDIPILLKQYLKLGGVLLGFNIDPDFSNVLDGLILVDLTKTDRRLLERYMGKEGAAAFLDAAG